jgi:hypothetical protein
VPLLLLLLCWAEKPKFLPAFSVKNCCNLPLSAAWFILSLLIVILPLLSKPIPMSVRDLEYALETFIIRDARFCAFGSPVLFAAALNRLL